MSIRMTPIDPAAAHGQAKDLLSAVQAKLGVTPNMMRTMAHSPAVLEGYLALSSALAKGALPADIREQLALAIGQMNGCEYCVSAHTLLGKGAGLAPEQIISARHGNARDPKAKAALTLARNIVERHGDITDQQLAAARAAGLGDAEIAEVVAHVAMNVLTNYFNELVHTEIDFPRVAMAL